jgi:hypothetical protein
MGIVFEGRDFRERETDHIKKHVFQDITGQLKYVKSENNGQQ